MDFSKQIQRGLYIGMLLTFATATTRADTYNFIFPSKKEKKESKGEPAIINNHIHSSSQNPPVGAPEVKPAPRAELSEVVSMAAPLPHLSRLRLGLGAWSRNDWRSEVVNKQSYGGMISLHADFFSKLSGSVFAGLRNIKGGFPFVLGMEAEFHPFRRTINELNFVELGFIAGASEMREQRNGNGYGAFSHAYNYEQLDVYLGSRAILNLNENLGLTGVVRSNGTFVSYEAGLISRF